MRVMIWLLLALAAGIAALAWFQGPRWAILASAVSAAVILLFLVDKLRQHFIGLERIRGSMLTNDHSAPPKLPDGVAGLELERLFQTIVATFAELDAAGMLPDERLQAIVASRPEALLVITEDAQVSLVNYPALHFLGERNVQVGTSIFAAVDRDSLLDAMDRAARERIQVTANLLRLDGLEFEASLVPFGDHGGMIISSTDHEIDHRPLIDHDLSLHDRPPQGETIRPDTPLSDLPVLVMDLETTGLDVRGDRVVSIGAVRVHGRRVFRSHNMDRLVNPGMAIPEISTSVHGITDGMVTDAPAFPEIYPQLQEMMSGMVIVGHNVAYDLAILRAECARYDLAWSAPPVLDTLFLASLLEPQPESLELESLAQHHGVDVHGRHTALGDSLVTAEIFTKMVAQLQDSGVTTFGQAEAFSLKAEDIRQRQKEAGW